MNTRSNAARLRMLTNGETDESNAERIQQLEQALEEFRHQMSGMRTEFAAEIASVKENVSEEVGSLKEKMNELLSSMNGLVAAIANTHQVAEAASNMATTAQRRIDEQADQPMPQVTVEQPAPAAAPTMTMNHDERSLQLRKMDTKPPMWEGEIDGIVLNSFVFQFEAYHQQKGYNLVMHDHLIVMEMNQSVKKNGATYYEQYMTDPDTVKTWSAMKHDMFEQFREPNFDDMMEQRLLTIKQTDTYADYVLRFRELQRVVKLKETTAMTLFYSGLSSVDMREHIKRKAPRDLKEAMRLGFVEQGIKSPATNTEPKSARPPKKDKFPSANKRSGTTDKNTDKQPKSKCGHCNKGFHTEENCWVKHPEKRPKRPAGKKDDLDAKIFAALQRIVNTPLN